jgi:hypothetical protein
MLPDEVTIRVKRGDHLLAIAITPIGYEVLRARRWEVFQSIVAVNRKSGERSREVS